MIREFFRNNLLMFVFVSLVLFSTVCFSNSAYAVDTDGDGLSDEVITEVGRIKIVHGDGTISYYSFSGNYSINSYADTDGQPGKEIILTEVDRVRIINDREGTSSYHPFSGGYSINGVTDTDGQDGEEIIVVTPGTAPYTSIYIISDASKNRSYQISGDFTIVGVQDYDAVSGAEICYSWEQDQTFYHSIIIDRTQDYAHYTDGCSWPSEETLDTAEPVTTASPAGGTYTSTQTVSLTCDDGAGSGCAATYYCIAPSATESCQPDIEYTAPLSVSASSKIMFQSEDNAGNREDALTEVYSFEYMITATSGAGGGISPGTIWVEGTGQSYTFTITPETGYVIGAVHVDGSYVGIPASHTFENIDSDHSIHADFVEVTGDPLNLPALSAGGIHSLALKPDGTVWEWGEYYFGPCSSVINSPEIVPGINGAVAISAGDEHSLALRADGTVWAWGGNYFGQFGVSPFFGGGGVPHSCTPRKVPDLTDIVDIKAGIFSSAALRADGTVWAWGGGYPYSPVQVGNLTDAVAIAFAGTTQNAYFALKSDGTVWQWEGFSDCFWTSSAVQVEELINVVAISGSTSILALKSDGSVWQWGNDPFLQYTNCVPRRVGDHDTGEFITDAVAIDAAKQGGFAILSDGTVRAWGHNPSGRLGDGSIINSPTPVEVAGISNVVAVSGRSTHSLGLTADGSVWSWGRNNVGQLGNGDALTEDVLTPEQIPFSLFVDAYTINATAGSGGSIRPFGNRLVLNGADQYFEIEPHPGFELVDVKVDGVSVGPASRYMFMDVTTDHEISATFRLPLASMPTMAAGYNHSLVLQPGGTVLASGQNWYGQLGDNTTQERWSPVQVVDSDGTGSLSGVVGVSAGIESSAALTSGGKVLTWGKNNYGQLGDGTTSTYSNIPGVVANSDGTGDLTDIFFVTAGSYHMAALRSGGTVWTWGRNNVGQLGIDTTEDRDKPVQVGISNVVSITAGEWHTAALRADSTVWTWGYGGGGVLGNGDANNSATPVQVVGLNGVGHLTDIVKLWSGYNHNFALRSDGTLWAWGYNGSGQLGDESTTNRMTPVRVKDHTGNGYLTGVEEVSAGRNYTVALLSDGTVWVWGDNSYGQLLDDTSEYKTLPVKIAGLTGVSAIAAGEYHALALTSGGTDDTVWAWGSNSSGQFGTDALPGSLVPEVVSGIAVVNSVAAGGSFTVALKQDETVWAWGDNMYGQLGDSTRWGYRHTPEKAAGITNAVAVSAGVAHAMALQRGGSVWTWGANYDGQLGDETVTVSTVPLQTSITNAVDVAAGWYHSAALDSDGNVWTWGDNSYGQLGNGTSYDSATPVRVKDSYGTGYLTGIVEISAGGRHTAAIDANGDVWTWGDNSKGQLGLGNYDDSNLPVRVTGIANSVQAISAGDIHTVALDSEGTVWAWGNNTQGQVGNGSTEYTISSPKAVMTDVDAISAGAGSWHTLALKTDGTVWAWGLNAWGQLGDNSTANRSTPVEVTGLTDVVGISAGRNHSAALDSNGYVWTWGNNSFGQLGVIPYPYPMPEDTFF